MIVHVFEHFRVDGESYHEGAGCWLACLFRI